METFDLKMCDVYSFGILVNEVITQKKPFEGITEENCLQRKVIDKEQLVIPPEYSEDNPLSILMRSCWNDHSPSRIPFSKILDPKDGLLLKENIVKVSSCSELLRTKLEKKYKEGIEDIDFKIFWKKFENVFGKENTDKVVSFFKILLNITDHQIKVLKKDAMRICDWLSGSDSKWIGEGFINSFFYQYYAGEKSVEQIDRDDTFQDDKVKDSLLAILHWDPIKNAFFVSVKNLKSVGPDDRHLRLKNKTISYNILEKEARGIFKTKFKDQTYRFIPSPLFVEKHGVATRHIYSVASSDKIASIYVY